MQRFRYQATQHHYFAFPFPALAAFALIFLSFLLILSILSLLPSALTLFPSASFANAFSSTSTIQSFSPSLFFPLYPHRGTHSPFSSSYTNFFLLSASLAPSFVLYFPIPFFRANSSHFVGGLGVGRGLKRGSLVSAGGKVRRTPSCVLDVIGQVVSNWFRSDCAPSRAVLCRAALTAALLVEAGRIRGFGSCARRWPRSKV